MSKNNRITTYEHLALKVGKIYNDVEFTEAHRKSFEQFYGEKGVPYFSLIHKGIKFQEFVGVLQVGNLLVEVLPKADKNTDEDHWRQVLLGMMKAVNAFDINAPSSSRLNIKANFILDLYFELFIDQVEYIFNKGLIKRYRKRESNIYALKGSLDFGKHIQKNLVHQERFYVKHSTYDRQHLIHEVLYKTLLLLKQINQNNSLKSRIGNLLLSFPPMPNIKVNESTFNKIFIDRKTEGYRQALQISKLLLLNYHPDIKSGQNNVLALMFDMNNLWEKFVYSSLNKHKPNGFRTKSQNSIFFWKQKEGSNSKMRPDILIIDADENKIVIDTKWKNIGENKPSPEDLRQLYVYHEYYRANKVSLVYPGDTSINLGSYYKPLVKELSEKECSLIKISPATNISQWQREISEIIYFAWLGINKNVRNY